MWFDDFEPAHQIFPNQNWHESPPLDFWHTVRSEANDCAIRARYDPLGVPFEDTFASLWPHRFGDLPERGLRGSSEPPVGDFHESNLKSSFFSEPSPPDGSNDDEVIVTGTRLPTGVTYGPEEADDSDGYTGDPNSPYYEGGGGGGGLPDDCQCSNFTDAQRQEQNVDAEVAEVLAEILAQSNQAMEYGSLIWIDSSGVVRHTSLIETPDERARMNYSDLPTLPDGRTDFSGVVAMVHSHPQYIAYNNQTYFNGSDPDYLLYPWTGDWASFDSHASLIDSSGGNSSNFQNYVIGFDGNTLVINQYDSSDRGTDTAASGDPVAPNAEACTC